MAKHEAVPPPAKRSVLARNSSYKNYTEDWESGRKPWRCSAHHILPVSCFKLNNIKCSPKDKKYYVRRCLWVSKWNVNGGSRFEGTTGDNNLVRLPTKSGYTKTYPNRRRPHYIEPSPEDECMHSGSWSEHYLYNKEVQQWLNDNIWKKLQENKEKHKGKGKSILAELQRGEKHFRKQLGLRGQRNGGTVVCWEDKKRKNRTRPFSMASTSGVNRTRNPI